MEKGLLERNLRWNNINGVLSTLANNMVGPFTGIFAIKLGATDSQIAALSSWPALVSLFAMIPGARLVDRYPRKKRVVAIFQLMNRVFFLGLALIPWLITQPSRQPWVFVAAVAMMNLPGAVANVAWQSFISTVIPADQRSAAFARRNQIMGVCGAVASLAAGRVMGQLRFPVGFQVMFFVGFALALLETASLMKIEEIESEQPRVVAAAAKRGSIGDMIRRAKNNPLYWRFAAASLVFHFGWQMAWPLFTKFQVQELHATPQWISFFGVCSTIGSISTYPIWARVSERKGNKFTLNFAAGGLALTPLFYASSTQLWMLAIWSVVMGVSIAGISLMLFNTLLEVSPEENRTQYIAYHNTATSITAVLAPYVGIFAVAQFGIRGALVSASVARTFGAAAFVYLYLSEKKKYGTKKSVATA